MISYLTTAQNEEDEDEDADNENGVDDEDEEVIDTAIDKELVFHINEINGLYLEYVTYKSKGVKKYKKVLTKLN